MHDVGNGRSGRVSRRVLLQGAVGVGVAAVASGMVSPRARAVPTDAAFTELDTSIVGDVVLPSESTEFNRAKAIFNTRYDSATPCAVVRPHTTDDVARTMAFADRHHLKVSARSGGHSYIGASSADGILVVDLRSLTAPIAYDDADKTVTVAPGTGLYDLRSTLNRSGRAIPTGTCPTVGCGGLTLGGGVGIDSRQYGLTCDRLTAATVVLPDGMVVTTSASRQPDLFWALRGGGGGTVGVVTSLTFRTHPATAKDVALLGFPGASTAEVIATWASLLPTVDPTSWVGLNIESDQKGDLLCAVLFVCPPGTGSDLTSRFTTAVGATPNFTAMATLSAEDTLLRIAGGSATAPRKGFAAGSDVLTTITSDIARAIVDVVRARSEAGAVGSVIIDPLDGAVQSTPTLASVFPWRRHGALLQWFVDVNAGDSYASATSWIGTAHDAVASDSVGAYVNYAESGVAARRYFDGNLTRLNAVRAAYDPTDMVYSGIG